MWSITKQKKLTEREREREKHKNWTSYGLYYAVFFPLQYAWIFFAVGYVILSGLCEQNGNYNATVVLYIKKRRTTHTLQKPELRTQIDVDMNLCYYLYLVAFSY